MFENLRRCGIIKLKNEEIIIQYKNKNITIPVGEITDMKLRKRWGRDERAGAIWGISVESDSNLYGYQVVISTKKRKYYVNSVDIGFGKTEEETRQKAETFAKNYVKIRGSIKND